MIQATFLVATGGAIGAASRFLLGVGILRLFGQGFPVAVMIANVAGSFLMGLAVVYFGRTGSPLAPFVLTGLLGGFTTFSAFSLEAYTLFERGLLGQAAGYVGLSVILSIAALIAGVTLARGVL
ncbi:MAG: fluoride efflux transporter CrcB [Planktomarina sp.]